MTPRDQAPAESATDEHGGLSYEQARDQLADVVRKLESGGLTLEQSLELWERGERLAAVCTEWLDGARARLAGVTPDKQSGSADKAPFL